MSEEYTHVLIAAGVSAAVSVGILFLKEKLLDPQKAKKSIRFEIIEKKLQVYGKLTTLIESAEENAKTNPICANKKLPHVLNYPDEENKLKDIFETSRHLISSELIDEYLKFVKEKETYHPSSTSERQNSWTVCNLSEMEEGAENELHDLKEEYEKLIK